MATLSNLTPTDTFDLLGHPHRRYVLQYLTTESAVVGFDTLASAVAASTRGRPRSDPDQREADARIGLHHVHLPKLADYGIVSYDAEQGTVELTDTESLDRFFDETVATTFERTLGRN